MRILTIDGGGVRGLVPALVLAGLEDLAGRPVHEMFDLIAGTSTGAILALGLTRVRPDLERPLSAKEIAKIYNDRGEEIFPRGALGKAAKLPLGHRYSSEPLRRVVRKEFGEAWLSECVAGTDVIVPTYDLDRRGVRVLRSGSARLDEDCDFKMRHVVEAACAAPGYFQPAVLRSRLGSELRLMDGGVFANNPTMLAIAEVGIEQSELVVSLGTGDARLPLFSANVLGLNRAYLGVPDLFAMAMDGTSETVHMAADALLSGAYFRLNGSLAKSSEALDDASSGNRANLRSLAQDILDEHRDDLGAIKAAVSSGGRE